MTGGRDLFVHRLSALLRWLVITAVAAASLALMSAAPAYAHGPTPDGTNYLSEVTGLAQLTGGAPTGSVDPITGVRWRVIGIDALLEVRNTSRQELGIAGYEGEPYLRVGPEGVYENRNSPAAYLNNERYGLVGVPASATADAEPDWRKVSDAPEWRWHDHRIHWMSPALPPKVREDPAVRRAVFDWAVPFTYDGQQLAVQGALHWEPPVAGPPWLAGATAAFLAPAAIMLTGRRQGLRAVRIAVGVFGVVLLADLAYAIGDVVATPASFWQHLWEAAQALVPLGVAAAFARAAWRAHDGADIAVLGAAIVLTVGYGLAHLGELTASQVANVLPTWTVRSVVAGNFAVLAPAVVAALLLRRSGPEPEAELAPAAGPA